MAYCLTRATCPACKGSGEGAAAEKSMSMQLDTERDQFWRKMADKVSCLKDRLGKPVDAGILETVVILNVRDIPTIASCEGHVDWGTGVPWVDIASNDPKANISIAKLSTEAQSKCERGKKTADEIAAIFDEVHNRLFNSLLSIIWCRDTLKGFNRRVGLVLAPFLIHCAASQALEGI